MNVVIAQLSANKAPRCHYDADDLFGDNQDSFYDGVEEHFDDDYNEDVRQIFEWLKPGLVNVGLEEVDGKKIPWLELDTRNLKPIFQKHWEGFQEELQKLVAASSDDFSTGSTAIDSAMYALKQCYDFDWLYVFDTQTHCQTIADWLRCIQGHEQPFVQRYYIHATYSGDQ